MIVDDLTKVGDVIDEGVKAGANQVEELSFQLKDDTAARREALTGASKQARAKADAIAQAMGLRIDGVLEVGEGGVQVMRPRMDLARAGVAAMEAAGTPVQPGQVDVRATVTDATGRKQEVRGAGVVGEQPVLGPGERFEYTSGVPLPTPSGFMTGRYQMVSESGEHFDIDVPTFSLDSPSEKRVLN